MNLTLSPSVFEYCRHPWCVRPVIRSSRSSIQPLILYLDTVDSEPTPPVSTNVSPSSIRQDWLKKIISWSVSLSTIFLHARMFQSKMFNRTTIIIEYLCSVFSTVSSSNQHDFVVRSLPARILILILNTLFWVYLVWLHLLYFRLWLTLHWPSEKSRQVVLASSS